MAEKKYVDLDGLGEFLTKLKNGYAANDDKKFLVNYAANAGAAEQATKDANGAVINTTYLTKVDAADLYVPLEGYVAYTTAEKTKLAGIAEGAQVNVIEEVAVKDEAIVSMTGKKAVIDLGAYAKKADIASVLDFKGVKATVADLPTTAKKGDVWIVTTGEHGANEEYVCITKEGDTGHPKWEALGATIDLSGYAEKTYVDQAVAGEAALREAADTALDGKIDGVDAAYKAADAVLDGKIDDIDAAYKAADAQEVLDRNAAITAAVEALDVTDITAPYFTAIGQTDGKIHATAGVKGAIAANDTRLVDGATVYDYVSKQTYDDHTYAFTSAASGKEGEFTYEEFLNGEKVGATHTITVNADVNKLEAVKVNGTALQIAAADKSVDIDMSAYTNQTLVAGSAEPCSSAAVLAAGFAYDADIIPLTNAEIDTLFA